MPIIHLTRDKADELIRRHSDYATAKLYRARCCFDRDEFYYALCAVKKVVSELEIIVKLEKEFPRLR